MFTSRAEYRLMLRHDNADERLSRYGRELGLVGDVDWSRFKSRKARLADLRNVLQTTRLKRSDPEYAAVSALLQADLGDAISLEQLAKRPGASTELVSSLLPSHLRNTSDDRELSSALADLLYAGYVDSHNLTVNRLYQHDGLRIPPETPFATISGLSNEIVERLDRAKPATFGAARRLPGLTPGALSTLLVFLSRTNAAA